MDVLHVGDTFASYQEAYDAVVKHGRVNRIQYWKRDSKKLHRASSGIYEIVKNYPQLEFFSIRFACIHGGQIFKHKSALPLKRKSRGTWKQNCKAEIQIGLSEDRTRLKVKKIIDEHNHEFPSEEVFNQLPKNRRFGKKKETVKRPQIQQVKTKPQKPKILENLVHSNSLARSNNLKKIAHTLSEKYDCVVDLQSDENDKIIGFFFQDNYMRHVFASFPEVLLIDGTYKLQNLSSFAYILSVEHSLGGSEVVGIGILTNENKESVEWLIQRFKDRNERWSETTIVVNDRQISEYKIAQDHFPNAKRIICLSHAVISFKKDPVPSNITDVVSIDSENYFEYFKALINTKNEDEYNTILEDMEDTLPASLVESFMKSWHELRYEWIQEYTAPLRLCISKLESCKSKIKANIGTYKTFSKFIETLFNVLYIKRNNLKTEFGRMITKYRVFNEMDDDLEYSKHLTPHACEKIKSVSMDFDQEMIFTIDEEGVVICNNSFTVSEISCNCDFFTVLKLPCKHLLAFRKAQNLSLFDEVIFSERWTKQYAREVFDVGTSDVVVESIPTAAVVPKEKYSDEKFQEANSLCLSLAELCCEVSNEEFEERIAVLQKLKDEWEEGVKVERVENGRTDHDYVMEVDEN